MKLVDTIPLMESEDYKERFKAEYYQLTIRIEGLKQMLDKYKNGTLKFTPTCSYALLSKQLKTMEAYAACLEVRATAERIDLIGGRTHGTDDIL